jgi:apolipoprotein N-acyltransferase
MYLAIYIPLMVAVTRVMVHRWRIPLVLAAPITWTGCELIRATFLTGYAATTLAHSQAWQPLVIQVADMLGHGGLSFLMIMFAVAVLQLGRQLMNRLTSLESNESESNDETIATGTTKLSQIATSVIVVLLIPTCVIAYGMWRIDQADREIATKPALLKCLLLQENTPTVFEMNVDQDAYERRTEAAWSSYAKLCRAAAKDHPPLDLVVWPESTFTAFEPYYDIEYQGDDLPEWLQQELRQFNMNRSEFETKLQSSQQHFGLKVKVALLASRGLEPFEELSTSDGPELLVGCDHARYGIEEFQRHSGAIWIGADGAIKGTYDKMHLVMFGEYIPLRPLLGWLEGVFGFAGADPGHKPEAFSVNGIWVAPNICFETMVPRLICWQVKQLKAQGTDPQLLVNLTNDSWFKGTSMLDHHLASSIICAVENRRPLLVAANTGLTAEIDGCGRLLQCTQRLTAQAVYAEPRADGRWGLVQSFGYPLSWLCAGITVLAAIAAIGRW